MSSFVIGKSEYVKAAGAVAGIASASRHFWVYDYRSNRNMTDEDYYNRFCECFMMNAISVQEQYHDETAELDDNDYKALFNQYRKKGISAFCNPSVLRNMIYELRNFFSSAAYQTEKEAYFFQMKMLFNEILNQLFGLLDHEERESWGEIKF